MNDAQKAYADAHPELGHLLTQIDTFYSTLPGPVKQAYDRLGAAIGYGCHIELEPGQPPDGCVIDEGRPQDCVHARQGGTKAACEYWRPIVPVVATRKDA